MNQEFVNWYEELYDSLNIIKDEIYFDKKDGFVKDMVKKASYGIPITRAQAGFITGLAKARLNELQETID